MKRSIAVPLGGVMTLAATFLAGCSSDEDGRQVCAVPDGESYREVEDQRCHEQDAVHAHPDMGPRVTYLWIMIHYGQAHGVGTMHPKASVHSTTQTGSATKGFSSVRKVPAKGGFGSSGKTGSGSGG